MAGGRVRRGEKLAIDLFAGAGGATQGLVEAGFTVVGAIELDPDACATYRRNHPDIALEEGDIRSSDPSELRSKWGLVDRHLVLLKACPPCPGFSTLGPSGANDPRNDLLAEVLRFLETFAPEAFLLENVPGIRTDRRLADLRLQATVLGYVVRGYDIDAADFGVPQRRRRHIVLGVSRIEEARLPNDLVQFVSSRFDCTRTTAGAALRSAEVIPGDPLARSRALRPKTLQRVAAVPRGGTRFDLPKGLQLACHRKLSSRDATGSYGRVKLDEPAPTMTTRCTTPSCGSFIHPTEDRGLTLREAAALQTFPGDYAFVGGYDSVERQIGNAVPVKLARALGVAVDELRRSVA